ncbi:MAG TPA: RES family NAD+ phosphorylase [Vicinamibacterales bacterium]|nr:RES family NAD+ phosphorylase [Vicinamibacterales bacterium]
MSSRTWTPAALSSERRRLSGACWRVVEAQQRVSTMKIVDTLSEQAVLESVLEGSKPPVPPECRHLHYLLATPFRYGAPYPSGSRFRRAGFTPGVFYGSTLPATAVGEMAFHRLLFYADSPGTPWPTNAGEYTAFSSQFRTSAGLDLTRPPLSEDAAAWTDPIDYEPCQRLADGAREARLELLKYVSARVGGGMNLAVLTCRAFARPEPAERQTWRIHLGALGARAVCSHPPAQLEFDRRAFRGDPRLARLEWDR